MRTFIFVTCLTASLVIAAPAGEQTASPPDSKVLITQSHSRSGWLPENHTAHDTATRKAMKRWKIAGVSAAGGEASGDFHPVLH